MGGSGSKSKDTEGAPTSQGKKQGDVIVVGEVNEMNTGVVANSDLGDHHRSEVTPTMVVTVGSVDNDRSETRITQAGQSSQRTWLEEQAYKQNAQDMPIVSHGSHTQEVIVHHSDPDTIRGPRPGKPAKHMLQNSSWHQAPPPSGSTSRADVRTDHDMGQMNHRQPGDAASTFARYDSDSDGFISRNDLYQGMQELNLGLTPEMYRQYIDCNFMYADVDRDERLSYEEYLVIHGMVAEVRRKFTRFDKDGDGLINKQDFTNIVKVG
mmetsp:Transcript_40431/g.77262  ORF Transcript_40431/g.77262 Transcript_40431/m.77262 type:complete len:266 (+) Transcript_40431:32-829(+)